jgi:DNA-binding transcriptional regulator GbsR (MarR family)
MSDISVMTEITEKSAADPRKMPPAIERFVLHWGDMGDVWGVNRSISQIHALLYLSDAPQTAEGISERLGLARSNVSSSLKELQGWGLVRRVPVLGDRRDHFEAEADMFEMLRRIAQGRKARELDPSLVALRACVAEAEGDSAVPGSARRRLAAMLQFMETVDRGYTEIMRLPPATILALVRMGGTLARFVEPLGRGRRSKS